MNMQSLFEVSLFLQIVSSGRLAALAAALVGLISVVIGRQALVRSARFTAPARSRAIAALVVGLTGMVLSALHLSRATGGFGTGSGRAGAIVGVVLGLTGMVLGGLALARLRRIAKGS